MEWARRTYPNHPKPKNLWNEQGELEEDKSSSLHPWELGDYVQGFLCQKRSKISIPYFILFTRIICLFGIFTYEFANDKEGEWSVSTKRIEMIDAQTTMITSSTITKCWYIIRDWRRRIFYQAPSEDSPFREDWLPIFHNPNYILVDESMWVTPYWMVFSNNHATIFGRLQASRRVQPLW